MNSVGAPGGSDKSGAAGPAVGSKARLGVLAQFSAGFAALLACALGLGWLALSRLDAVESAAQDVRAHWLPTTRALGDISFLAQRFRVIEAAVVLAPAADKPTEAKTLAGLRGDVDAAIASDARLAALPSERDSLDRLKSAWARYVALDDRFLVLAATSPDEAAQLFRGPMREAIHDVQDMAKAAVHENVAQADAASARGGAEGVAARRDLLIGLAAVLVLSLAVGAALQRSIVRPIRRLTVVMRALAAGATEIAIPGRARKDEIGDMARACEVFERAAQERRTTLEDEARRQQADALAARTTAAAERERATTTREAAMFELGQGLRALAEGDLGHSLGSAFPQEFHNLRDDYEEARARLAAALGAVFACAAAVSRECGALGGGADALSARTEQQAASLEESSAALQQISVNVQTASSEANKARTSTAAAHDEARRAGEVVGQAVAAMAGVSRSSQEIGEITGLIDEIAFQTSLLALNASVEAARAGDAGRGFAVVASEVRALAQRSAGMAKRISEIISASDAQVRRGVESVGAAGAALGRINDEIDRVKATVEAIASGAADQARALKEISGAVSEMDQVTQRNAAMVAHTTDATRRLAEAMGGLEARVGEFHIEDRAAA